MIGVRHSGIVVRDMERSRNFYVHLLGLKEAPINDESGAFIETILGVPGVRVRTCKMPGTDGGTTLLELLQFTSHLHEISERFIYSVGPTHVAFTVNDLDELHARLTVEGVEFISDPKVSPDGNAKVAFCYDPDGTPIELVQMLNE